MTAAIMEGTERTGRFARCLMMQGLRHQLSAFERLRRSANQWSAVFD
jgi:hypothetical protein